MTNTTDRNCVLAHWQCRMQRCEQVHDCHYWMSSSKHAPTKTEQDLQHHRALLFGLVYYLWLGLNEQSGQVLQGVDQSVLLSAVLIGLTAVTFPHLILVSRCAGWLAIKSVKA